MKIVSLAISKKKGTRKKPLGHAVVQTDHGMKGDAHAGPWHRQVSLLATESIEKARRQGLDVSFGDFAENIATEGIDLVNLKIGTRLKLGLTVVLEISQIGKICHNKCAIYYKAGDCIMPKEGVFARVIAGGEIQCEDAIEIIE
jgi:MOSC domain-containing protein YiiM